VIVNNLDDRWPLSSGLPLKTDSPPIINANAVLTLAVARQGFKSISGQRRKISNRSGGVKTIKLNRADLSKPKNALTRLQAAKSRVFLSR